MRSYSHFFIFPVIAPPSGKTLHESSENSESKFQHFFIIIDVRSPENLYALVWFRSGEKPRSSLQKFFQNILKL